MNMMSLKLFCLLLCFPYIHNFRYTAHFEKTSNNDDKIVGGRNTNISEVPYQASVEFFGIVRCGACLISLNWLVSAAHCFANLSISDIENNTMIRVGSSFKQRGGFVHSVKRVVLNPGYNNVTQDNDIALIELKTDIVCDGNKAPIRIVSANFQYHSGTKIVLSGFGITQEGGQPSDVLQSAVVSVVSDSVCHDNYSKDVIRPSMFCANAQKATVCSGDSGGPGVIDGLLAGVISADWHCQPSGHPTILTKIPPFFQWIVNITDLML